MSATPLVNKDNNVRLPSPWIEHLEKYVYATLRCLENWNINLSQHFPSYFELQLCWQNYEIVWNGFNWITRSAGEDDTQKSRSQKTRDTFRLLKIDGVIYLLKVGRHKKVSKSEAPVLYVYMYTRLQNPVNTVHLRVTVVTQLIRHINTSVAVQVVKY